MGGTVKGGKRAAQTLKQTKGEDWYQRIGQLGGSKSSTGGFAYFKRIGQTDKISAAGKIGGSISRRGNTAAVAKARAEARKRIRQEQLEENYRKLQKIAQRGNKRPW